MKVLSAIVLTALLVGSVASSAVAVGASGSIEPTGSVEVTGPPPPPLESGPGSGESGPVGVWLALLSGQGTDSRDWDPIEDPSEVRWHFALTGAPEGTEFSLWAQYASGGEVEIIGFDQVAIVTPAHDILVDAHLHCILPSDELIGAVALELVDVEVVPSPPAVTPEPDRTIRVVPPPVAGGDDDPFLPYTELPANSLVGEANEPAEPFLPYTGSNETLPVLAALFAAIGFVLRKRGATE